MIPLEQKAELPQFCCAFASSNSLEVEKSCFKHCGGGVVIILGMLPSLLCCKGVSHCFSLRRQAGLCRRTQQTISVHQRNDVARSSAVTGSGGIDRSLMGLSRPNRAVGVRLAVSAHLLWI